MLSGDIDPIQPSIWTKICNPLFKKLPQPISSQQPSLWPAFCYPICPWGIARRAPRGGSWPCPALRLPLAAILGVPARPKWPSKGLSRSRRPKPNAHASRLPLAAILGPPQSQNGQARIFHGVRPNPTRMHDVHANQTATTNAHATRASLTATCPRRAGPGPRATCKPFHERNVCVCVCVRVWVAVIACWFLQRLLVPKPRTFQK